MIHRHGIPVEEVRTQIANVIRGNGPLLEQFHELFYRQSFTWGMTRYRGHPVLKNPCDLWIYQEVLHDTQPTLLVETGTACGGSAWYFADVLAHHGGRVLTIDVEPTAMPPHPGVTYLTGGSTDPAVLARVAHAGKYTWALKATMLP